MSSTFKWPVRYLKLKAEVLCEIIRAGLDNEKRAASIILTALQF